ncbi:MAG TPA: metallophosphoesterase [Methanomicrobiales archaeon]|jgi:DNA repair exonuclease SbcCD nuclease subunit|nr:metallophosphoesterase [Methanomicrobiales archaeon]
MRFVHIGDSHLGLSQFSRLDEDGGNLRERLVYDHFLAAIDAILRLRPDALVHAGDLFQSVRPRTRAYITALEAITRLGDAGIPLVVIAGNHDMRRSRYTPSPFEILGYHHAPFHAAYGSGYQHVDLGDTRFHLIPNLLQPDQYREEFDRIEPAKDRRNVLVTHGLASTLRDRRLGTVMEHEIDTTMLSPAFDYIALGHFHGQAQVADNAWYCGSQEYISYAEAGDTKGGLLVDLEEGSVVHLDLPCSHLKDLGELDCTSLTSREIGEEIAHRAQAAGEPGEPAMAIITLAGAERRTLQAMDPALLQEARDRFLDLKIAARSTPQGAPLAGGRRDLAGVDYGELFGEYLKDRGLDEARHRFVLSKGREVIRKVMAGEGGGGDAAP